MTKKLEKPVEGPAAGADASKQRTWFGRKNAAALGLGAACVAALVFAKTCGGGGGPEPIQPLPQPTPAPIACPAPVESRCNFELGEHDPGSTTWAPQKCGYCGDGIQQAWETRANCPVDFHCGDGETQSNTVFGAYVLPEGSAAGTRPVLGTKTVTESCREGEANFCAADCQTATANLRPANPVATGSGGRRNTGRRSDTTVDTPGPAPASGGGCDPDVVRNLQPRLGGLGRRAQEARTAIGAGPGESVRASVRIVVSGGIPSVSSISLSSPGKSNASLSPSAVNFAGVSLGSVNCSVTLPFDFPPG